MIDRPIIKWPDNARVAFWVAPNIEHYEYLPLLDGVRNPWPRTPLPDVQQYSLHEYGNRVGFWRVLEVLDHYQIRCSTTLNIGVLQHFPDIADAMLKRDWTFVNHGFYNTRYLTTFSEEQEREFLQSCRDTFKRLTGRELKGQSGPAASNTEHTPDIVAEVGFTYQTDWKIDDHPLPIKVRTGRLVCIPYTSELNDAPLMRHHYEADYYAKICRPSLTSSTARVRRTAGCCASPSTRMSWAARTGQSTWQRCWTMSRPTIGYGRPPPTRSLSTIWLITTSRRWPMRHTSTSEEASYARRA
jgi:hypothetical protein